MSIYLLKIMTCGIVTRQFNDLRVARSLEPSQMEHPSHESAASPEVAETEEILSLSRHQVNLALGCTSLVYDIAFRMSNGNPFLSEEDALSDGNFGLIRAASNFAPGGQAKFSTYAYTCIRGEILSGMRKRTREENPDGKPLLHLEEALDGEEKEDGLTLADILLDTTITYPEAIIPLVDISRAINTLPDTQRRVFLLSLQGLSNKEIAEELNVSGPAVSHVLQKAVLKIRKSANLPTSNQKEKEA